MNKGKIIFLNGASSSGKSSLVIELQKNLPEPYYCLAQDTFTDIICPWFSGNFNGMDSEDLWFQADSAMHNTIKLYSDLGLNVIVDEVFIDDGSEKNKILFQNCIGLLKSYPVLFVHVDCPLEELKKREIERGDRDIGNAEWQLPLITPKDVYDIEINTHENTLGECAKQIIARLDSNTNDSAFSKLYKGFIE